MATNSRRRVFQVETLEAREVPAVMPDLVVSALSSSASTAVDSDLKVTFSVKNQGNTTAKGSWDNVLRISADNRFHESDIILDSFRHGLSLAPGESQTFEVNVPIAYDRLGGLKGDVFLLLQTDAGNTVGESTETNNTRTSPLKITLPQVNLVARKVAAPATGGVGDRITLTYELANTGKDATTRTSNWVEQVYLGSASGAIDSNDVRLDARFYDGVRLASGAALSRRVDVTLPTSFPPGKRYLKVVVDTSNVAGESSRSDDLASVALTLKAPDVDLVVTSVTAPTSAALGDSIRVAWKVRNQGTKAAFPEPWVDRVYLSTSPTLRTDSTVWKLVQGITNPGGLAGKTEYSAEARFTIPATIPTGNLYVIVRTDDDADQAETDDGNNTRSVPISITRPQGDLTVKEVKIPTSATVGQGFNVSYKVTNGGSKATLPPAEAWNDRIYLSPTAKLADAKGAAIVLSSPSRTGSIAAGGTTNVSTTVTIPNSYARAGSLFLIVVADDGSEVIEANEANNSMGMPISVTSPDLKTTDLTVSPGTLKPGDTVKLTWNDTNAGNGIAKGGFVSQVTIVNSRTGVTLVNTTVDSGDKADLAPGAKRGRSATFRLPTGDAGRGDLAFTVTADPNKKFVERNTAGDAEDNNGASLTRASVLPTVTGPMVVVDVTVNDGIPQRSMVRSLTLTFNMGASLAPDAITLYKNGVLVEGVSELPTVVGGKAAVILTFHGINDLGGSLTDGRYQLRIGGKKVKGSGGQKFAGDGKNADSDLVYNFHRLFGDSDGNGTVDSSDEARFSAALNKRRGNAGYLWYMDADDDGLISVSDLARMNANRGKRI